jgi:glycosyltransferase involved in cell wall biosynthesis
VRIYFDSEIFLLQKIGGISKYFAEVINVFELERDLGIEPKLTFRKTRNLHLLENINQTSLDVVRSRISYLSPSSPKKALFTYGPIKFLNSTLSAGSSFGKSIGSFFHATYYRPNTIESFGHQKLAITIHDFIPEKLGWAGIKNPHFGKKKMVQKADLIFCVSQTTADDLCELYGDYDSKIKVVHHGVKYIGDIHTKIDDCQIPQVLYVGHRAGYKNFSQLSQAMKKIWKSNKSITLSTVGPEFSSREVEEYIGLENTKLWKHHVNVSDDELNELYRGSAVMCMPSRFEGFGLPIIEALSQGTSVAVSNIKTFREIAHPAAHFFELDDVDSTIEAIERGISNATTKNSIRERIEFASQYTWRTSARQMSSAYSEFSR